MTTTTAFALSVFFFLFFFSSIVIEIEASKTRTKQTALNNAPSSHCASTRAALTSVTGAPDFSRRALIIVS